MRSAPDQRSRGRYNGNRPLQQQPRVPQNHQTFDSNGSSNGSGARIRGNASQIYERYLAMAREAATNDDRVAAENFYQHAEHYFRVNNAGRDGDPTRPSHPISPAPLEPNSAPAEPSDVGIDRAQPWGEDDRPGPFAAATSTS